MGIDVNDDACGTAGTDLGLQPPKTREWSPYQNAIFAFCQDGHGNAIVEAVAGSGKTTTIVDALKRVRGQTIFLAFNKAIAEELKRRGVNARTFHSLTYRVVTEFKGARTVNADKLRDLVREWLGEGEARMYGAFITKLVGLARQVGVGCLIADEEHIWNALIEHHELELESEQATYTHAVKLARELLTRSNASNMVDFDDLLYIAVKEGLSLPKFDFIFVDEAQDTNAIQRALLRKLFRAGTRLVAVGDPAQAIYGFRGADSDSMNMISEEFNCIRLPLTVSYRCPQAVVQYARQWVSHIEPAPNAPLGAVHSLGEQWKPEGFVPGDLVVCRTTKPLVSLAYACMRARIPAKVMGREIGSGLAKLVDKMRARGIEALQERLMVFTRREVEKAIAKNQEAKAEAIQDKTDTLLFLIDTLPETERTIPALQQVIHSLFTDTQGVSGVTLATIHKAKGLEAPHVYWLNSSKCPSRWARQDWQKIQETNLMYVATTRAMEQLSLIEDVVIHAETNSK